MDEKKTSDSSESKESNSDCAICLQSAVQPVKLPCNHIFCFLCAKGLIQQNNQCALCRMIIPRNYLNNPQFVRQTTGESNNSYRWFYRGQSGWWQYDDRTCAEIEAAYQNDEEQCEVLIAGNLYIIDFSKSLQMQKHNLHCCRQIKRDLETIPKKGIAGVYLSCNATSDSDNCKAACSNNDSCGSTAPIRSNGNSDFIIVIPNNISGVCVNLNNKGASVSADTKGTSSNSCKSNEPEKMVGVCPVPTVINHPKPNEESPMPATSSETSLPISSGSRPTATSEILIIDDVDSSSCRERKRRKVTDTNNYTNQDIYKSFSTTIVSKLQNMSETQRLFSEKLINDALFKGLLGKLTENSCISEST